MQAGLNRKRDDEVDEIAAADRQQPDPVAAMSAEVLAGLAKSPKEIAPKYFYDQAGSALFDEITRLDEYYLPRVERQIFEESRLEMCAAIGAGSTLVEPGAGSCEKIKWLLPELQPDVYMPMDISGEHLEASAARLKEAYPDLTVVPQVCDHTVDMSLNIQGSDARPVFFYPGSSIGNFSPVTAEKFVHRMLLQLKKHTRSASASGGLLIGVDAKKDAGVLNAAYSDSEGVTARFNLNVLNHLNDLLDGNIPTQNFVHHAFYNEMRGRIEMHLRCIKSHTAVLAGQPLEFTDGELVHTEYSYKYHPEEFIALAERAGFTHKALWQDAKKWYSFMYFEPA